MLLKEDMTEARPLRAAALDLTVCADAPGTAVLTLMPGEKLPLRSRVRITDPDGESAVYIAGSRTAEGDAVRVTLRHGLCTLGETVLPDEDLTFGGPAGEVIARILACQTVWQLQGCALTERVTLQPGCVSLLSALTKVLDAFPDYALRTDQSALPWKLSVVQVPEEPEAEGRLTRNVSAFRMTSDASGLCTRVVSETLPGGSLDGDTAQWVVIEAHLAIPADADEASALAAAERYLSVHGEPAVSVTLSAADLSASTGEPLDRLRTGRRMRLCLPGIAVTRQRITEVRWPDALGAPEQKELTLANRAENVLAAVERLEGEQAAAERRVRTAAAAGKANTAKIAENASRISDAVIQVDRNRADIALKASQTEVTDLRTRISNAGIDVDGDAASVTLMASQKEVDRLTGRVDSAESSIAVNADNIALKVSKNGVISAINQTAESVTIRASRIDLSGYVTATQLSAVSAKITDLMSGDTTCTLLSAQSLRLAGRSLFLGTVTIDGQTYNVVRWGSGD